MAVRDWSPGYLRGLWLRWLAVYGVLALALWAWPCLTESPGERASRRALAAARTPTATRSDSVRAGLLWAPPSSPTATATQRAQLDAELAKVGIRLEHRGDTITRVQLSGATSAAAAQVSDGLRIIGMLAIVVLLVLTAPLWMLAGMTIVWYLARRRQARPTSDPAAG